MSEFDAPQSRVEALLQNLLGADNPYGAPQSRIEAILQNMLGANNVLLPPESRNEELLLEILQQGGGGGKPTQTKTATPTEQEQTITPDEGYVLSEVTVNPIPSQYIVPTGKKTITANATDIDIAQYATADVAVPTADLGTKNITANGTYAASSDNLDGYSQVTVVVPMPDEYAIGGSLADKTITGYHLNQNITSVYKEMFTTCSRLESITIPNGVTTIGNNAFWHCSSLKTCVLPDTIIIIGQSCFRADKLLELTSLPPLLSGEIAPYTFDECEKITISQIPIGITSIGTNGVSNCKGITSLKFNGNITRISSDAFNGTSHCILYDFVNNTAVPTLDMRVFNNNDANFRIVVPDLLYNDWVVATNWINYDTHIVKESDYNA